ncbi:putative membrane protein [Escherichia phage JLBYU43]|uniref:Membrane protein n=1 Tax=Escherichia phage JLBYU43 TaxID=2894751 RepID=A0AAE9CFN4_9CAUD|nr:putative membrane protein [Escherichia phage JLBYU43]
MFSIVIAFIIGILAGVFGTTAAINKHRKYIAGVSREIAERERKFDEKRAEFEREWSDGSRASRRRFRAKVSDEE